MDIGRSLLRSLQFIHSKGIVHCDLKPANFIIGKGDSSNKIFLADFGLATNFKYLSKDFNNNSNDYLIGNARYASLRAH